MSLAAVFVLAAVACRGDDVPDTRPQAVATRGAEHPTPSLDERGLLTLDSLGVLATYGMNESEGRDAILQRPLDAAFLGEHVLVLDASAPWVRRFELDGRFDSALVRSGEGPGEATQPHTLAATQDGFLLSHSRGIERFGASGDLIASMRDPWLRGAGAVECDGGLFATSESRIDASFIVSRALKHLGSDGMEWDTLAVYSPARHSTRNMWTWFADVRDGTVLVYTEEEHRPRLERWSCDGGDLLGELALDSIGPGLAYRGDASRIEATLARAPHPAGLARISDRTLWATRRITSESDSITMVEAFDDSGGKRRLPIDGWYQIFDADAAGRLLLGNSWTLGNNWRYGASTGDTPAVLLVDGHALLAAVDAHGTR